jgi:hypothetical protein
MKRCFKKTAVHLLALMVLSFGPSLVMPVFQVQACGWGDGGGGGFVPQRHDTGNAPQAAVTADQARQIIENHVQRLNSALRIGKFNDAGSYYEAEIVAANNEVVQIIGVDKRSGQLVLID